MGLISKVLRKISGKEVLYSAVEALEQERAEKFRRYDNPLDYEETKPEFNQEDALRYCLHAMHSYGYHNNTKDNTYTKEELPSNMSIGSMSSGCSTSYSHSAMNNSIKGFSHDAFISESVREDNIICDETTFVQCWACKDKDMRVNIDTDRLECKCGFYIGIEEYKVLLSDNYVEVKEELEARALIFKTLGKG